MEPLYRKKLDLLAVLKMKEEGFYEKIKTLGLARTKAKNVIKLSEILLSRFLSKIPSNREDLESLPGVGRKTANVVLAELYKKPTLAVDTHVFRLLWRLGWADSLDEGKASITVNDTTPAKYKYLSLIHI